MTARPVVPFDYGFFFTAMVGLLGREPDTQSCFGLDGFYRFRYEPKNAAEGKKLAEATATLARWLNCFDIIPLKSRCEYGLLPYPQEGEENKRYLDIHIVHPVEEKLSDSRS